MQTFARDLKEKYDKQTDDTNCFKVETYDFYEDRDFTSHYPILYKIPEEVKQTVIDKLALVDKCVAEEVVPPSDKSECMFCTYKAICREIDELEKAIEEQENN